MNDKEAIVAGGNDKLITFVDRKKNAPVTRKGVDITGERAGKPPYFEQREMNEDSDVDIDEDRKND